VLAVRYLTVCIDPHTFARFTINATTVPQDTWQRLQDFPAEAAHLRERAEQEHQDARRHNLAKLICARTMIVGPRGDPLSDISCSGTDQPPRSHNTEDAKPWLRRPQALQALQPGASQMMYGTQGRNMPSSNPAPPPNQPPVRAGRAGQAGRAHGASESNADILGDPLDPSVPAIPASEASAHASAPLSDTRSPPALATALHHPQSLQTSPQPSVQATAPGMPTAPPRSAACSHTLAGRNGSGVVNGATCGLLGPKSSAGDKADVVIEVQSRVDGMLHRMWDAMATLQQLGQTMEDIA
jgi:hypothetical protein